MAIELPFDEHAQNNNEGLEQAGMLSFHEYLKEMELVTYSILNLSKFILLVLLGILTITTFLMGEPFYLYWCYGIREIVMILLLKWHVIFISKKISKT